MMIRLVLVLLILKCFAVNDKDKPIVSRSKDFDTEVDELRKKLFKVRGEALQMKSDAQNTLSEAFEMRKEALELKEDAFEAKMEAKMGFADTLSFLRSQAAETTSYLKEMKNTFYKFQDRIEGVEKRFEELKAAIYANGVVTNRLEDRLGDLEAAMVANGKQTTTIMTRQKMMMTEVRLISLYKMTNQSTTHSDAFGEFGSDLAVDGQFVFSEWGSKDSIKTMTHTLKRPNQKLWIDLGGLFRIHRIKIWNYRMCCWDRFIGTHIYADERLLGVAHSAKSIYEYQVSENDPTYARSVILHQVNDQYLMVTEVQVWGTGPFSKDDLFA